MKRSASETRRYRLICPECGNENLIFESEAKWDIERQAFIMYKTYENGWTFCEDCGEDVRPKKFYFVNQSIKVL